MFERGDLDLAPSDLHMFKSSLADTVKNGTTLSGNIIEPEIKRSMV